MSQTSVNPLGQPAGFPGLIADNSEIDSVAGFSEEASASILFGTAVAQGTAPQGILNMSSSGDFVKGIVGYDEQHAPGAFGDLSATGLVYRAQARVVRRGRIWVVVDPSVVSIAPFEDRGFVRYSVNGGDNIVGAWNKASDGGHNTDLTKVCIFVSGIVTAADGTTKMAQLEVDFTNKP